MKSLHLWAFVLISVALATGLSYSLNKKQVIFQTGPLSYAHHQLENDCSSCHSRAWSGAEAIEQKCKDCHQAELAEVDDAHNRKKFADPRNAEQLTLVDATRCLTCHKEHVPALTRAGFVTQPVDFCIACHQDIPLERPTHKDAAADSCGNSGCHNYHDNTTLYESFLAAHQHDLATALNARRIARTSHRAEPLTADLSFWRIEVQQSGIFQQALLEWQQSEHFFGHANCQDCHQSKDSWAVPDRICTDCHQRAGEQFQAGHHGMRLQIKLPPINVIDAQLPMADNVEMQALGCQSCHKPHLQRADFSEADSCLACHRDQHSANWEKSKHAQIWRDKPDLGASCATCHLPRVASKGGSGSFVNHNQSHNLRPSDKMLKTVCLQCHGLEYALSALAENELIQDNFSRPASGGHPSMEWVRERNESR